MKRVMVRYTVKPECVEDNVRRIQAVFAQLDRERPHGIHYASYRAGDSFVHIATIEGAENPLTALAAFKEFAGTIKERCLEPPVTSELEQIGSYRS